MDKKTIVTAAIGAIVGITIGYAIYTRSRLMPPLSLIVWLTNSNIGGPAEVSIWAASGAAIAIGLKYLFGR